MGHRSNKINTERKNQMKRERDLDLFIMIVVSRELSDLISR